MHTFLVTLWTRLKGWCRPQHLFLVVLLVVWQVSPLLEWKSLLDDSPSQRQKLSLCFLEFLCCRFEVLISELWTQLITTQNKQSGRSDDKRNMHVYACHFPIFIFWSKPSTALQSCKYFSARIVSHVLDFQTCFRNEPQHWQGGWVDIRGLAAKSEDLSSIPTIYMEEGKNWLSLIAHAYMYTYTCTNTYTIH